MNLCLDIGNTFYKVAIFDKKEMIFFERFKRGILQKLRVLYSEFEISEVIISSTRKRNKKLILELEKYSPTIELSHETLIPIQNNYDTPETLGRDRLAGVIGAYCSSKTKRPYIVIDAGTCITYDFIDKKGVYLGGNIAPGIHMRLEAMHHFTQKLPSVEMKMNPSILGKTTKEAIQNGAVYGTLLEIEAFILRMTKKHRGINIILTGGDAKFLGKHLKREIFVDHHLVLRGLNEILTYNATNH